MSDWLLRKPLVMHSGSDSDFKIECDALTNEEVETFAMLISQKFAFGEVEGIQHGGLPIAAALQKYCTRLCSRRLIVDDVLTTGLSMKHAHKHPTDVGVVLFARGPCPYWVHPVFQMWAAAE